MLSTPPGGHQARWRMLGAQMLIEDGFSMVGIFSLVPCPMAVFRLCARPPRSSTWSCLYRTVHRQSIPLLSHFLKRQVLPCSEGYLATTSFSRRCACLFLDWKGRIDTEYESNLYMLANTNQTGHAERTIHGSKARH